MKKRSVKCERAVLVLLFAFAVTALFVGSVAAVTHTEVEKVTRNIPDVVEPDAEFEVTLSITYAELPLVVGIVETMPEAYSFVSCPTKIPAGQCSASGDKVAFTVICKEGETEINEIKYKVKAPSTGRGTFEGEFVDLLVLTSTLPEEEGKEGGWHTIEGETMNRVRAIKVENFIFDTGSPVNPYPSIFGIHNGTITPNKTIIATKLYAYPCPGTGGHTEYARIGNKTWNASATWEGYAGDWHNITFDKNVVLLPNEEYNYTIRTGSYPQIHHTDALPTANGWINCTQFTDANGKVYNDRIPAIRLW